MRIGRGILPVESQVRQVRGDLWNIAAASTAVSSSGRGEVVASTMFEVNGWNIVFGMAIK
jgi:hypothetical protein